MIGRKYVRARANMAEVAAQLVQDFRVLREALGPDMSPEVDEALAGIETHCAVSIRVMAKTNPSKIRDAAMAEEIKARIEGREVIE